MKKTLFVTVILAAVAAVLFYLLWPPVPPEQQVCEKLVTLCGVEKVSAQTCTEGLIRTKKMLGDEGLAAAEDCVLQAKTCALAAVCMADKGLRALTPFVEALLTHSAGSAKQLANRLVTELQQKSSDLGRDAKLVVSKLSGKLSDGKQQISSSLQAAGRQADRGKEAALQTAKEATETVTAAQKKVREQISAEIAAAEAKVQQAHTSARKWVSDTIDSVGQEAKRVGDTVARQARRILGGKEADAGASAAKQDPVKSLEEKLAQAKSLISSERFADARALLGDLSWLGSDTKRDEQMAAYYRAMRKALLEIVDRRQKQ